MRHRKFFTFDIQHFAAPADDKVGATGPETAESETGAEEKPNEGKQPEEKLIPEKELQRRISIERKKIEKEFNDKKEAEEEAARLEKMNKEEREQHENQKLKEEVEKLRKENNFSKMGEQASEMLTEEGIKANKTVIGLVVRDTAEDTKEAVEAFVGVVQEQAQVLAKEMLKGKTPPVKSTDGKAVSWRDNLMTNYQKARENN